MVFWDILICLGALLVGSLAIMAIRAQRRSGRWRLLFDRGGGVWAEFISPTIVPAFFGGIFALFVIPDLRQRPDLGRVFFFFVPLVVPLMIIFVVNAVKLARRTRYTLAEFVVLVLLTGLGMGLTAKALPAELHPALAAAPAVLVGISLFSGGLCGLYVARWLGVESPRRRIFLLLHGLLLVPALAGAIAAGVAAIVLFGRGVQGTGGSAIRALLLTVTLVLGAVVGLILFATIYRLVVRAREAERRRREEEEEEAAAPEVPHPSSAEAAAGRPDLSPKGEGDADREA